MYTHLLEANYAPLKVDCGTLTDGKASVPVLDVVMTVSDDGKRRVLAAVNKSPDKAVEFDVSALSSGRPTSVSATVLAGASPDDYNDIGAENRVVPVKTTFTVKDGKIVGCGIILGSFNPEAQGEETWRSSTTISC